jgi:hypothetical protein
MWNPLYYNSQIRAKERRERAMHALEQVGLSDRFHTCPISCREDSNSVSPLPLAGKRPGGYLADEAPGTSIPALHTK